jgi:hypothetical protein
MKKVPKDFGQNVFLNCPFDQDYKPLFEAAVFTVQIAGLTPRCALEASNAGQARLEKIMDIISECRFGIHDISRTELGPGKLPRFNMPLELGLDLGCSRWHLPEKRLLILDRSLRSHHHSASDLEGHGIVQHANNPRRLVHQIRDWLSTESPESVRILIPGGQYIYNSYCLFRKDLPQLLRDRKQSYRQLTFPDYSDWVRGWLQVMED